MASWEQDEWVGRILGLRPSGAGPAGAPPPDEALRAWTEARAAAIATLGELERAIRGMNDPMGNAAIVLVRAIAANLTEAPRNAAQIAELRRYVATDPIIGDAEAPNGFGITVSLRAPLLRALDAIEPALAAPGD